MTSQRINESSTNLLNVSNNYFKLSNAAEYNSSGEEEEGTRDNKDDSLYDAMSIGQQTTPHDNQNNPNASNNSYYNQQNFTMTLPQQDQQRSNKYYYYDEDDQGIEKSEKLSGDNTTNTGGFIRSLIRTNDSNRTSDLMNASIDELLLIADNNASINNANESKQGGKLLGSTPSSSHHAQSKIPTPIKQSRKTTSGMNVEFLFIYRLLFYIVFIVKSNASASYLMTFFIVR